MNKPLPLSLIICLIIISGLQAQSNLLSNSPYSLYGLGVSNNLSTGKTNALGNTGIALPSATEINNLNPASYGAIPSKSFFYDIGLKYEITTLNEGSSEEVKTNGNFSNLAFALALNEKSGIGLSLIPYTNVGYSVSAIETAIEGSQENFYTYIEGHGGLNEFKLNYGYSLSPSFRIGATGSLLFGKITEDETDYIGTNILEIKEENRYSGMRLGLGMQYDLSEKFSLGSTINLPASLGAEQDQEVYQYYSSTLINSTTEDNNIDNFKLPLELGLGINAKIRRNLSFYVDYKREFWDATGQTDELGSFTDQDIISAGLELIPGGNPLKYTNYIQYRAGFNYNSGYLRVNEDKVNSYGLSLGIGLPVKTGTASMFNLTYSYGRKGQVNNGLIQENYHLLTLNISLQDFWFQQLKFN
ncbi:autotransporter outer membrane beta-barrel domain-containing protein [Zunongwangia sp. H14]|uniref:autotransporter outer membrane beta-barrel domain-containing protein n=1 Tax=Zunongwangia sp. H14 TaxID=3240792 RepID=UPI0035655BB9